MRLLQIKPDGDISLTWFRGDSIPRYAILSHTWGKDEEEVTYQELLSKQGKEKAGFAKIRWCGEQAKRDGLQYFWVDTCCINKESSQELTESINSMFVWYKNAERCYVYLTDVSGGHLGENEEVRAVGRWKPAFRKSRWFSRGWTLQELIAPNSVEFFSREGTFLGSKDSLRETIQEVTNISCAALKGQSLETFDTAERLSWMQRRQTTRGEDMAYCLLGIFDVHMPLIYSEGEVKAMTRLRFEIDSGVRSSVHKLTRGQQESLLRSLRFEQIDARQANIKTAHSKTCRWLLTKTEYLEWLEQDLLERHHGFLWIKGKPGAGKSTIMKFALTYARQTMKDRAIISFFFNARGGSLEKSTNGTYRSLLLQLLEHILNIRGSLDFLAGQYDRVDQRWSQPELEELIKTAIQAMDPQPIMCFIDALDECDESQVRDMISFFEQLGALAISSGLHLRICLSSRHYPHITIEKGIELILDGQKGHKQDITNYVGSELKIGKSELAQEIRAKLQEKAMDVFMWVVLVVGILNKEHDRGRVHALRQRLNDISSDLDALFHDILTRDLENRDEVVLCLQWVLFAQCTLPPEQLYFAILAGVDSKGLSTWDSVNITPKVIKRFVLDSSRGLVEVVGLKSQKVQFIHESVRDFLLEGGLGKVWPDLRDEFEGRSHENLKQSCCTYLSQDFFSDLLIPAKLPKANSPKAASLRHRLSNAFPFLEYAIQNTLLHADAAQGLSVPQRDFISDFDFSRWIRLHNIFEKDQIRRHHEDARSLYILAELECSHLVALDESISDCFHLGIERYRCPMFAALATQSIVTVKMLKASLASRDGVQKRLQRLEEQTICGENYPLQLDRSFQFSEAERGVLEIVLPWHDEKMLAAVLEITPSTSLQPTSIRPYLLIAIRERDLRALELCLNEIWHFRDKALQLLWETCLSQLLWAGIMQGSLDVVKLLLKDPYRPNKDISHFLSSLWTTVCFDPAIVKSMVDSGKIDVDSRDKHQRTLLFHAAQKACLKTVDILLDSEQVSVNKADVNGDTPLAAICARADKGADGLTIIKRLLEIEGVEVNPKPGSGRRPPLLCAIEAGDIGAIRLLLDKGDADLDLEYNPFAMTPRYAITCSIHPEVSTFFKEWSVTGRSRQSSR